MGSLCKQAEKKSNAIKTLVPDLDNASVGSDFIILYKFTSFELVPILGTSSFYLFTKGGYKNSNRHISNFNVSYRINEYQKIKRF